MGDAELREVDFRGLGSLVVVTGLEVALGVVELVCVELLEVATVDADGELALLVADLVGELGVGTDLAGRLTLLGAVVGSTLLDAQVEVAGVAQVELSNRLVGDGVVDVDLANADLALVLGDLNLSKETVGAGAGAPRAVLTKLAAAVLAVLGGDALAGIRDLHDHGAVTARLEPLISVALAALELVTADLLRVLVLANRLLQGELGKVEVAARCALGIKSVAKSGGGQNNG